MPVQYKFYKAKQILNVHKHSDSWFWDYSAHPYLGCAQKYKIWAFRKAAWALEDLQEDVSDIYAEKGRRGLEAIKGIGKSLSQEIEAALRQLKE